MLLVGCGGSDSSSDTTNTAVETAAAQTNNQQASGTYGQITAIDDTTITVALGTMKQMGNKPNGDNQTKPSGKPDAPTGSDDANAPQAPTGSDDANKKGGNRGSMLDLTGETQTITISDSTKISIKSRDESKDGTISDLQVGDIISFELSDDNKTATTITSQSFGGGGDKGGQAPNASAAPEATAKAN